MPLDAEEKEKRRKKQFKRMGKILGKAWNLTEVFQDCDSSEVAVGNLSDIGQKLDEQDYRVGRHGWEDFARDLGGVYNRHVKRKTKHAAAAKKDCEEIQALLGHVNESLAKLAAEHVPAIEQGGAKKSNGNKRRASDADLAAADGSAKNVKKQHRNKNSELATREERAMEQLATFVEERNGDKKMIAGFRSRVTRKGGTNKFDVTYYNEAGRRFRSMVEVGRFFKIVDDTARGGKNVKRRRKATSREQEAEKKRIRKDLDKLRKAHQRATKALDDFVTVNYESSYPIDDQILMEERQAATAHASNGDAVTSLVKGTRSTCAAARVPDVAGFPGVPEHCTPDILMAWDFLCTFERALSLTPIALDDFVNALVYTPPEGQMGDDVLVPPVYIAEAHLGLLKLLLQDRSSDDWWWSTLESAESEGKAIADIDEKEETDRPVIKINIAAALAEVEDPLITASWLSSLEKVSVGAVSKEAIKNAIKTALAVVSNKWIAAYLRKSLDLCKTSGAKLTQRSIHWIVRCMTEARPDLSDRTVKQDAVFKARAKVVEEVSKQMEGLGKSAPTVTDEDAVSDVEYEEEESDDESDDEEAAKTEAEGQRDTRDDSEKPASSVPPKPLPSLVDMLLPPAKPQHNSDFVDSFTWSHVVGATAARVLHRKKRILNEVDDYIRDSHELPLLVVSERRERESLAPSRVLTECVPSLESPSLLEKAIDHLCSGGNYLDLSPVQRLCVLRLLIEAAYDTLRVYEVVSGNYKQRTSAVKSLDVEKRRAKREAREKAAADEAAAREQLAAEVREKFIDEKREEIRKLNQRSKEFSDDVIESLTEEDIIDFDDDIKADYEALPAPESFNKTEVTKMVARLQEEAAFDTDVLRVLTLDELVERERRELEEMDAQFAGLGGENALLDDSLDRTTIRSIERLRKDIERARSQAENLPELRRHALEQLQDAMEDGTIKVLRTAYNAAKKAKLFGADDETGGIWAVDLIRDAALELEKAKQNKRLLDAQKDLVAKRNKCFIRSDPMGRDRFGNRFWMFSKRDESAGNGDHIWVETELSIKSDGNESEAKPPPGFLNLARDPKSIAVGASDMEGDFIPEDETKTAEKFRLFSRKEYHSTGFSATLAKHHWGCHATEDSLRAVIKSLDSKGIRENELRTHLKEALEDAVANDEKHENREVAPVDDDENEEGHRVRSDGDESVFLEAKEAAKLTNGILTEAFDHLSSGIGAEVRVRKIIDDSKDPPVARYENGTVNAWKIRRDKVEVPRNGDDAMDLDDSDTEPKWKVVEVPVWRVLTERGHTFWLLGEELTQSISRSKQWNQGHGYFENDAAFFSYRNAVGRHCGRAADAPYSSSPFFLAKLMINREAELYPKLKIRSYDNSWGGQSGARALWTNSMKDYAYDFVTVRQGLLTLESAIYELTGEFVDYQDIEDPPANVQALIDDPATRIDIELESIEKIPGLWNSPTSRAIYHHIVSNSTTTGFLALALDLLCRNTMKYLQTHKLLNVGGGASAAAATVASTRTTRRMNAWQQQQQEAGWY